MWGVDAERLISPGTFPLEGLRVFLLDWDAVGECSPDAWAPETASFSKMKGDGATAPGAPYAGGNCGGSKDIPPGEPRSGSRGWRMLAACLGRRDTATAMNSTS